jgi:Protein of unknown function (DUF5131)
MAENSKIQWTDSTFNPWEGCTKVAPECQNCYAEARAIRWKSVQWGPNGTRRVAAESKWREPVKWNKAAACQCGGGFRGTHSAYCPQANRPRVFCASLADVFESWGGPGVPDAAVQAKTLRTGWGLFKDRRCESFASFSDVPTTTISLPVVIAVGRSTARYGTTAGSNRWSRAD